MWRSERLLIGPDRATPKDIAALNRLFSDAFTDRYRRDGMQGVRVPYLNPAVWQYALANAGEVTIGSAIHRMRRHLGSFSAVAPLFPAQH